MSKILGIDLGTTFSAMAITESGEPRILENKEGHRTTPSIVAINKKEERLIGELARRQMITNPKNTIHGVKRLIGRKYSDPEVKKDLKNASYKTRKTDKGRIEIKMGDKWYKPVQISAMILKKLKHDAEKKIGEEIKEAVITCPAYFDDDQRQETKAAGKIAGLKVRRIINEPTAAALAYGLNKKEDHQILVYDFGGGTFDVSVLEVSADTIEVKSTGGDTHLGGNDFDQEIMEWIIKKFKDEEGVDLGEDELALQRIKEAAEKAKIELSNTKETDINLPFVTSTDKGPKHLQFSLRRAKLEDMVQKYIDRSLKITKQVLKDGKAKKEDIDEIVLVGGQTRMPKMQEAVKEMFEKKLNKSINPDEVVAIGAATQAGILQGDMKDVLLLDVTPLSLGIETLGGVSTKIIEKNTTIPTKKSKVFSTAEDNQDSVQIHVLQGERPMASDNKSLGKFILDGIPPAPKGVPKIEVTFDIDADGILNVSAKDKGTDKKQSIRIEGSTSVSEEEVEKMKKEAEEHEEEDQHKKELIEVRNKADSLIYSTEKSLRELEDAEKSQEKEIKEKIKELKDVKEKDDVQKIKEKIDELAKSAQKIGEKLYKQKQAQEKKASSVDDKKEDSEEESTNE